MHVHTSTVGMLRSSKSNSLLGIPHRSNDRPTPLVDCFGEVPGNDRVVFDQQKSRPVGGVLFPRCDFFSVTAVCKSDADFQSPRMFKK